MKKILLTNHYSGTPLDIVKSALPAHFSFSMLEEPTAGCLAESIADADYLLAGGRVRINENVLSHATSLKMIQRSGVGLDSINLEALRKHNIPLYVNKGVNSQSVAEHALLLMLACLRRLTEIHNNTVAGIWKKQEQGVRTFELHGKTVGLIGMGSIARKVARLLKPFDVRILYFDPYRLNEKTEHELSVEHTDFNTLLGESDIVSLHCPMTDENSRMINGTTLSQMKRGAILVNTARGGLVDSAALHAALQDGRLSFAGLDVHETEPIPAEYPLKSLPNIILTPHVAGVTADSFRAMMTDAMRNIELFELGRLSEIEQARYQFH
ncbi:MAG: 2-hydroxyacid dehydrogenase [Lentisphaeria bacterium]|nr:2-hydroxyacid dehydrogenase [Lentisphaeria bacterium]